MGGDQSIEMGLFFAATFAGAVVAGMAGFAFGLVVSALWLHIIAPSESAPLIAAFAIVIQGMSVWALRKSIDVRRLLPFIVGGALGIPLGVAALSWTSAAQMRAAVGVMLVGFSLYLLLRPKISHVRSGAIADGIVGLVSGVLGGGTGLGGIPIIIWSAACGWSKDQQRAIFQPVAIAIFLMSLAWMGGTGLITANTLRLFALGLPAVLIGTWAGLKLYGRLDEASFRNIVLVLLLISGASLLWSAVQIGS